MLQVRVGAHTGTLLVTSGGYVGDDVHFAARVAASSHGGQILLSKATAELVEFELTDLGEHRLKDITEAVQIFQLGNGSFPPLKTISNTNLPRPASSFVGEKAEVEAVLSRIEAGAGSSPSPAPAARGRPGSRSRQPPHSSPSTRPASSGSALPRSAIRRLSPRRSRRRSAPRTGFLGGAQPVRGCAALRGAAGARGGVAYGLRAGCWRCFAGSTVFTSGQIEDGIDRNEKSLDLYRRAGDERGIAIILNRLGVQVWALGDAERGRSLIEESLGRHRALRFGVGEAVALGGLGRVEYGEGNVERGLELVEQSAELCRVAGFIFYEAQFLDLLASYAFRARPARRGPQTQLCGPHAVTQNRRTAAQGLVARTHRRHRGQTPRNDPQRGACGVRSKPKKPVVRSARGSNSATSSRRP